MKTKTTSIRMDTETRVLIDRLSQHLGVSKAAVIRLAVRMLAEQYKLRGKNE